MSEKEREREMATSINRAEERKRRIQRTGSDRLALITGRLHMLPSSPSSATSSPFYRFNESSPRNFFRENLLQISSPDNLTTNNAGPQGSGETVSSTLSKQEKRDNVPREDTVDIHEVEPQPQKNDTNKEAVQAPPEDVPRENTVDIHPVEPQSQKNDTSGETTQSPAADVQRGNSVDIGNQFEPRLKRINTSRESLEYPDLDVPRRDIFDIGNRVESQSQKYDTDSDAMQDSDVDDMNKSQQPSPATSIIHDMSNDKEPLPEPSSSQPKHFSPQHINYCIAASQGTRSFCALVIAVLVVLSYIDYPLFGGIVHPKSIVTSRPLYILLLTDVTIVVAHMFLDKRRESEEDEKEGVVPEEDADNFTLAMSLMDRGLVVYHTIKALFVDFSIYAVIVISGLSLAR